MDLASLLYGFSKALYSNWLVYKPDNLLIDCGEGAATTLGNNGYAIESILLTHGHIDHLAGLPSLIWTRAGGMGDNEKPLAIYYPAGDGYVADMRAYLQKNEARLPFQLSWNELQPGAEIALSTGGRHARRVVAFATRHISSRLTLGYKIVESRRRLKAQYGALAQDELQQLARQLGRGGSDQLSEDYDAILAAFGGDGLALPVEELRGAEIVVHEATLLDAAERRHQLHSTVVEALEVAAAAGAGTLLLNHFSGRYRTAEIMAAVSKATREANYRNAVWCLFRDRLWQAMPAKSTDYDSECAQPMQ